MIIGAITGVSFVAMAAQNFGYYPTTEQVELSVRLQHASTPERAGRLAMTWTDVTASTCMVGGMAYRDDYALALMETDNKALLRKVVQAANIIAAVHADHHLVLNWLPSKTELTLRLTGPSAKPLWAGLRRIGASAGFKQPALALRRSIPEHQFVSADQLLM
eukprot:226920-Amphidinium_carterae.1